MFDIYQLQRNRDNVMQRPILFSTVIEIVHSSRVKWHLPINNDKNKLINIYSFVLLLFIG